jgi:prolyl oligopeptidase
VPVKRGQPLFLHAQLGAAEPEPLYVREGLDGEQRLLIDPNAWAADAATALSDWRASPDGSKVLYSVQDGGTDWRIIRVLDAAPARRWRRDPLGQVHRPRVGRRGGLPLFALPRAAQGQDFQALNYDQAVYYHRLGTPQSATSWSTRRPSTRLQPHRERDQRRALGGDHLVDRHRRALRGAGDRPRRARQIGWATRELVTGFDNAWSLIDSTGGTLWFATNKDAPRYKVVALNLDIPGATGSTWCPRWSSRSSSPRSSASG